MTDSPRYDTTGCPRSTLARTAPTFLAFLAAHPGALATISPGAKRDGQGDVMVALLVAGSRPGYFIKPDVTAPGVQILAGATPFPSTPTR